MAKQLECEMKICYVQATPEEMILRDRAYTLLGKWVYQKWLEHKALQAAGIEDGIFADKQDESK